MIRKGSWVACVGVRVGSKQNDLLRLQGKRVVGLEEERRAHKEFLVCRGDTHGEEEKKSPCKGWLETGGRREGSSRNSRGQQG